MKIQPLAPKGLAGFSLQQADDRAGRGGQREGYSADRVTVSNLKSKLHNLSAKLQQFRTGSLLSDPDDGTAPQAASGSSEPESAPSAVPLSVSFQGSDRFVRKARRQLAGGFRDGDTPLLQSSRGNLHGTVTISVATPEGSKKISVEVDRHTTAQEFVDRFNEEAGGAATASLQQRPNGNVRIALELPPNEGEEQAEGQTVVLGNSDASSQSSGLAESVLQDLKGIVKSINEITKFVQEHNAEGGGLSLTGRDEQLVAELTKAVQGSSASNGTLSLGSLLKENGSGGFSVRDAKFATAFVEDPDAIGDLMEKLAEAVGGSSGIARKYSASAGELSRGYQEIAQKRAQVTEAARQLEEQRGDSLTKEDLKALELFATQLRAQ